MSFALVKAVNVAYTQMHLLTSFAFDFYVVWLGLLPNGFISLFIEPERFSSNREVFSWGSSSVSKPFYLTILDDLNLFFGQISIQDILWLTLKLLGGGGFNHPGPKSPFQATLKACKTILVVWCRCLLSKTSFEFKLFWFIVYRESNFIIHYHW